MTESENWLPQDSWSGHRAQRDLVLGPFFAVSGLIEDSDVLQNYYFKGPPGAHEDDYGDIAVTLQQRLGVCRVRG